MPSKRRRWQFRVRHILEAVEKVQRYVEGRDFDQFARDSRTVEAVVWNLMIIGEAARHVPPEVQRAHPEVPWSKMRGMRNQIVHGYDQVDLDVVWRTVRENLAPLPPLLQQVLEEIEE